MLAAALMSIVTTAAEQKSLEEDGAFWDRFLARSKESMSLPPTLPPVEICPPKPAPKATLPPVEICPPKPAPKPTLPPVEICPPTSVETPSNPGTSGDCEVDVTLKCETSDGRSCSKIKPPDPLCSDAGNIKAVSFGYTGSMCDPVANSQGSESFCSDFEDIEFEESVTVLCKNADTGDDMNVRPDVVKPAGVFTVTAPGDINLPDKIDCIFIDENENKLQQVIIDVSGDVTLRLTDEFGAFTVLACESEDDATSCLGILTFDINIENGGEEEMDITAVDFIFNGKTSLVEELEETTLKPGDSISLTETVAIDVCSGSDFSAKVDVEAESTEGDACQDADDLTFSISPLPLTPENTQRPVDTPVRPPGQPPVRPPLKVPSQPVSQPVKQPVNIPIPTPAMLPVSSPVPTPIKGPTPVVSPAVSPPVKQPVYIPISAPVNRPVSTPVSPPLKVPAPIVSPVSPPRVSPSSVVSPVTAPMVVPTPVSSPIAPSSSTDPCMIMLQAECVIAGDSSAAGRSCDTQTVGATTLAFAFSLNILVPLTATNSVTLSSLEANTNFAGVIDLTDEVIDQVVSPGGSVEVTLNGEIDPTVPRLYEITFNIEGTQNPAGLLCSGSDTLSFVAGNVPSDPTSSVPAPMQNSKTGGGSTGPGSMPAAPSGTPKGGTSGGGNVGAPSSPAKGGSKGSSPTSKSR